MVRQSSKEKDSRINENERLEEESLEHVAEAIVKVFKKRADEVEQEFNQESDKIVQEFNQEVDKVEKKYRTSYAILVIGLILVTICSAFFNVWFDSNGFTDYYHSFDEIKSMVAQSIEEPFSMSIVFVNASEATLTLDFEGEANDTVFILENVKWDLKDKKIYLKESVVEKILENYK